MSTEDRLSQIEARLDAIERCLRKSVTPAHTPQAAGGAPLAATAQSSHEIRSTVLPTGREESAPVTNILGWAGATALVLASIYLVVLAIDSGWLTPPRQLVLSIAGGLVCIGVGLLLRGRDMHYASLLPAAGIVIVFRP